MNWMKKISAFKNIIRPNTWLRIWGEMIVGAVLSSYPKFNFSNFILIFVASSPLIWSAAYILNDLTDVHLDKQHPLRKQRIDALENIGTNRLILIIIFLVFLSLFIGLSINHYVFFLLCLLFLSQILYTLKPFRFKERLFFDIFLNSINSALRFLLGWFSQSIIHQFSLYPLLFFVSVKIVLFLGHRMQNKKLEEKNGIRSTVAMLSYQKIYTVILSVIAVSIFLFLYSIKLNIFPVNSLFGIFLSILPLLLIFKSRLFQTIKSEEENLKLRNLIYLGYFIFTNILAVSIYIK